MIHRAYHLLAFAWAMLATCLLFSEWPPNLKAGPLLLAYGPLALWPVGRILLRYIFTGHLVRQRIRIYRRY